MSQHIACTELNLVAEVARRLANGGLSPADVQALLEKQPLGESSLDDKLFDYGQGVKAVPSPMVVDGVSYRRHVNGGGWVPVNQDEVDTTQPFVSDEVFVGPQVIIRGGRFLGGQFYGGEFKGGRFDGGRFLGGVFHDGVFYGGVFEVSGAEYVVSGRLYLSDADRD